MKKTFKFFAAALTIVAAASCAKEISNDNMQNENPTEETVHMTISASFDSEGETKTVLAENKFVHWTDNDAIRLFGKNKYDEWELNNGVLSIDPASNDDDPTFAVFSGETKPSTSYYAVSPASGWTAPSGSVFQFEGLSNQIAVKGSFDPSKHIAMSVTTSGDVFHFQNACALLKVKLDVDNVYSLKIEGNNGGVGIGKPIRFTPSSVDISNIYDVANYSSDIVLKNSNSSPLEKGATYYIVVPHLTISGFKLSLCDANGNVIASKSKKSDFKIERNKIYDLGTLSMGEKYKKGNHIAKASDLKNNGLYIIEALDGDRKSTNKYWNVISDGTVKLASVDNNEFAVSYVFKVHQSYAGTDISGQTYAYKFRGAWSSVATGQYISNSFKAELNSNQNALYTILANGWYRLYDYPNPESGADIDMYDGYDTSKKIKYNDDNIVSNGSDCSKWYIYEAIGELR